MILHKIHFDNSYLNTSYILKDLHSNEAIIIDVPEDPFPIIEHIEKLKVKIKLVLLTHHHFLAVHMRDAYLLLNTNHSQKYETS